MLARLAFFDKAPEWDTGWVTEAARSADGCTGVAHLLGPEIGDAVSLSFYTDESAVERARQAISAAAAARGHEGRPPDRQGLYDVLHSSKGTADPGFARVAIFDDPYDDERFGERSQGVLDVMATLDGFARAWFLVAPDRTCISLTLWKNANALDVGGPKLGEWHAKRGDPPLSGQVRNYDVADASFD